MNKLVLLVIPIFFTTINAWADVQIKNDQTYVGDDGTFHLVGEVQNRYDAPLGQVNVIGKFYDSSNNMIFTKTASPLAATIMPEMKVPFDIMLTGKESEKVAHYSLEVDHKVGSAKSQVIDIVESKMNYDTYNNLFVSGVVANKGDVTANIVSVVATMYDRDGKVAAVSVTRPEPDYLRVNDAAFFIIPIQDKKQSESIVDYTLIAESDEYTAVPEFPVGSWILLAVSVFSYIGVTRVSERLKANLVCVSNPR